MSLSKTWQWRRGPWKKHFPHGHLDQIFRLSLGKVGKLVTIHIHPLSILGYPFPITPKWLLSGELRRTKKFARKLLWIKTYSCKPPARRSCHCWSRFLGLYFEPYTIPKSVFREVRKEMHRLTLEVASDTAQAPTWRSSAKSFLIFLDRCPPKMVAKSTQRELSCCLQLPKLPEMEGVQCYWGLRLKRKNCTCEIVELLREVNLSLSFLVCRQKKITSSFPKRSNLVILYKGMLIAAWICLSTSRCLLLPESIRSPAGHVALPRLFSMRGLRAM
jgi:hypothetical protein